MRLVDALESRRLFANYTAANVAELINGITRANRSPESDTITLSTGTTFSLTAVNNTTDGATGLPVILPDHGALTIFGNGATIERSSANTTPAFRLFSIAEGASLALADLTLQRGLISEAYGLEYVALPARGGGIYNRGSLSLDRVTIQNMTVMGAYGSTPWGGPLLAQPGAGGAIYSSGTLSMTSSTIRTNTARGGRGNNGARLAGYYNIPAGVGADGLGGGIFVASGTATIINSIVSGNKAEGGFGGYSGATTVRGGNAYGGGVYAASGTLTLRASTITTNAAVGGGGLVYDRHGRIIPGNFGTGIGGGLYVVANSATLRLDSFTVGHTSGNTADSNRDIFGSYVLIT